MSKRVNITPWTALATGAGRIGLHKRLLFWLYLVNIAFAAVLVYPFRRIITEVGRTDLAEDFVNGFDMDSFVDVWAHCKPELKTLGYSAMGLGLLYLLVSIFLTAGIVSTLTLDHRVTLRRFLSNASRYFGRYLRLFVVSAVVIGAVLAGHKFGLEPYLDDLAESETTDRAAFLWKTLDVAIVVLVLSFVMMVFDYARIRTVVDRRRSMIIAFLVGLAFSVRRAWRTGRLFGLNALIAGFIVAVYFLIENAFSNATAASMIGLFVVQQVFILSRIWIKLSFFASQLALYGSFQSAAPSPEQRAPVPYPGLEGAGPAGESYGRLAGR